jgi:hypothetical protein
MTQFLDINNQSIIDLVDKTIKDISGQQMVPSSVMTDLLLDIRLYLLINQEATPAYES